MRTDSTQPCRLADREMDVCHDARSCHGQDKLGTPADHVAWEHLPKLFPVDLYEAAHTFSWKTAVGPTRVHPRSFADLSNEALQARCALYEACERLLIWPSSRIVNEMVSLGKPDGGTRLITLVESLVRLWARARRRISRAWVVKHGSPFIWGNRRG